MTSLLAPVEHLRLAQIEASNDLLNDPLALKARFAERGYLYLKGLLPRDMLVALQAEIFNICQKHAWLDTSASSFDNAISHAEPTVEGEDAYLRAYDDVQRSESFHSLPHAPQLMKVMQSLLDETAFPHPLSICRLVFPNNSETTTPPHQDFPNNQGTEDLYACWIPLVECPQKRGGLAFMPGSHKQGLLPLEFSLGAGNRQAQLTEAQKTGTWLTGDYQIGDVLIFHSLMLHRALDNQGTSMRISVDYRYQSAHQPLTAGCLEPHFKRLSWSEIYQNWKADTFQYYWHNIPLKPASWTNKYHQLPDSHMGNAIKLTRLYKQNRSERSKK